MCFTLVAAYLPIIRPLLTPQPTLMTSWPSCTMGPNDWRRFMKPAQMENCVAHSRLSVMNCTTIEWNCNYKVVGVACKKFLLLPFPCSNRIKTIYFPYFRHTVCCTKCAQNFSRQDTYFSGVMSMSNELVVLRKYIYLFHWENVPWMVLSSG